MSGHIINPNLRYLHAQLKHRRRNELLLEYKSGKINYDQYKAICLEEDILSGVVLEGSSRSFKTISSLDFIVYISSTLETSAVFNIIKETYVSFKTTLYNDFNWRLPQYGIRSPFQDRQEVKSFKLFGNKINLIGADSESAQHGVGCDYLYVNEALDVSKAVRDQAIMRCRKFWWMDLNPKYAEHDIFTSTIGRPDVGHIKTTYKDNLQISPQERTQIESYQPVELSEIAKFLGSQDEDEVKRFSAIQRAIKYDTALNPDKYPAKDILELKRCQGNEETGTANKYMWLVYGLGERMAPDGLIFPNVTWIKEFPKDCPNIYWGSDFGYTVDPSTLVKIGIDRKAEVGDTVKPNMYLDLKFYEPTPTSNDYINLLRVHIDKTTNIWADPSGEYGGRGYISSCRNEGYQVYACNSFPGSIEFGISIMKKYNLCIVDHPAMRKEQAGYIKAKAKVNGVWVVTDTPVDANNHAIGDAPRMACIMNRL